MRQPAASFAPIQEGDMGYTLAIGDRTYSSWSLRGWLLFEKFGIETEIRTARMYTDDFKAMMAEFSPSRLVPAMKVDDQVVWDTLAMAETLAERHPDAGYWPKDAGKRALARSIVAEMHSGFTALRSACTANLRHVFDGFQPSDSVLADTARIEMLWDIAFSSGQDGPWLFGDYSIADVFFAPVATRFVTYGLPAGEQARKYIDLHINDLAFRQWRARGLAENFVQPGYDLDLPTKPWPVRSGVAARAVAGVNPVNNSCPYSGDPVSDEALAEVGGTVIGFCNPFCRDKTVADPEAWPAAMALLN
jgi:glutathione S-transferase